MFLILNFLILAPSIYRCFRLYSGYDFRYFTLLSPQEKLFKKNYARDLLKIAFEDLNSAQVLSGNPDTRKETNCFLAQQAIEKALKAVLVWHEIAFPLVPDAGILVAKLPKEIPPPPQGYDLSLLTQYATMRCYEEGPVELTKADVKAVLEIASHVYQWARKAIEHSDVSKKTL